MAKDITIRVTGQNADGSLNVQPVDGGNPFMSASSAGGAMVPYNPSAAAPTAPGYRAKINGVDVMFASEADYLKADRALRDMMESQNIPALGGVPSLGSGLGGRGWLRTGADAASAVANFLQGRNIRRKLRDYDDALQAEDAGIVELDQLARSGKYSDLIPVLIRIAQAERSATETSLSVLEDELTAVDIQTGSGVAKVADDLMEPRSGTTAGGSTDLGTVAAVGLGGLAIGGLFGREDRRRYRRR